MFATIDEIGHLPAAVSCWRFGRFDLYEVNPPAVRLFSGIPAVLSGTDYDWSLFEERRGTRPEFRIGLAKLRLEGIGILSHFWWPRYMCTSFSVLGMVILAIWIRRVGLSYPSVLICMYWCFAPSFLAFGSTIVPDMASVCLGLLAAYCLSLYIERSSLVNAGLCGAAMGFALLSKLTWLAGLVSFPASVICCICMGATRESRSKLNRFADIACFTCIAVLIVNAGYLAEGSLTRLGDFEFLSHAMGGDDATVYQPGNRFGGSILKSIPIPFPRNYVEGIDYLRYEVETKYWSFLNGEWKFGSWPYYYIMTTLYKTPESTLLGALIGLVVLVTGIVRGMVKPEVISMFLFLIIPAAVSFAAVSLQGGFNHHHRYVLMIYPPMFALAAYIASPVGVRLLRFRLPFLGKSKHSIAVPLAFTLVALSAASSLRVHPYYTSYFNTISGGPANGWRLLGFSNIDWGQDILEVDKWLKENPEKRPLVMDLDYFGMNGELFDVPTSDPPQLPRDASIDEVRRSLSETQWWIISVKKLYNRPGHDGLEYLQQIEPIDRIAYAYHVYRIDPLRSSEPPTSPADAQ